MNQFEVPASVHNELNPVLWDGERLKEPVHLALLKIADVYRRFLGIDTALLDIVISGSQVNYNYSDHSDIDLHLIMDYEKVSCPDMDVEDLFNTKRKLWKEQHDIDLHGIPVEVYVEDLHHPAITASYSIVKNQWIRHPSQPVLDLDEDRIIRVAAAWAKIITNALKTRDIDLIEQAKDMLWAYRKKGLAVEGEYGAPNLVFKALRNTGATEALLTALRTLKDRELSLENIEEK